jgi:hypothetical protein
MSLQARKNVARKALAAAGLFKREGENKFDKYKYFSEAQYKQVFVKLFAEAGLEFNMTTISVESYPGYDKMPYGRRVTVEFQLKNIDDSETESAVVVGEALDKGDKAIYKAYTGALKYYFACVFHLPTGDEVETSGAEQTPPEFIEPHQIEILTATYTGANLTKLLAKNKIDKIEKLPFNKAVEYVELLRNIKRIETAKAAVKAAEKVQPEPSEDDQILATVDPRWEEQS